MDSQSSFEQHRWLEHVRESLSQDRLLEDEADTQTPVSIFSVSKSLMVTKPDVYIPQLVAIGPYHHWRSELYEMERYKLAAARRTQDHLQGMKFEDVVDQFAKLDFKVRASYNRYLDLSSETIAWMMAVDASFLMEFLRIYGDQMADNLTRSSSRMSQVIDYSGKSMTHNAVLRDIIMVENQIPLFLLKKLVGYYKYENPNEILTMMLMGLCRALSPFKRPGDFPLSENEILQMGHLLELLYHVCVPKVLEETRTINETPVEEMLGFFQRFSSSMLGSIPSRFVRRTQQILTSRMVKSVVTIPLQIIGGNPKISASSNEMTEISSFEENIAAKEDIERALKPKENPLAEEIAIPSVTELSNAGVRFCATNGYISTIKFDNRTGTIHLPSITFDENTEVVLRNLVALEATSSSMPQMFSRYTDLMNGIIGSEEDVKILRENGVLFSHLKRDKEVADQWNGMTRSVRLSKVAHLDKVIKDVNRYYSTRWRIRFGKLLKKFVFASWPLLTFIAANLFLLLTALQLICNVISCGKVNVNFAGKLNSTLT